MLFFQYFFRMLSYLVYGFFCILMLEITLQYIPIDLDVAFLRIKQDEIQLFHYKIAFYVHVFTAIFSLLAGFTQFSVYFRTKYPIVHRYVGGLYIVSILLFAAPSGLIMAYYANGGFWSQLAFSLLSIGWFWTTYTAYTALKEKDYKQHQRYMMRSFALTMSAITLRMWKYLIVFFWHPRPMDVYRIVAWLGWVFNLLIIELIIYKYLKK
ncbi:MAG: DUF2306 domain-containing protein [uncultured Aureispira sp.]|uniref:DUF2306 domain-containing protein n=1 Tax=uncultured Aureispira sp. TaxID=1331704 RepID=A0A6S6U461_9BACT|nr:MAG: DUF2306 domain-containing protein [uncultured Aureispira sp.]